MKKIKMFFTVIASLMLCSAAYSQDSSDTSQARYLKHPWAMQFSIRSSFSLSSFRGSVLALSRDLSENERIRISVSGSLGGSDDDQSVNIFQADTLARQTDEDYENSSNNVELTVQYLHCVSPRENTSFFFAVGPAISAGSSKSTSDADIIQPPVGNAKNRRIGESNSYSLGVLSSAGVEWFPSEIISLHAEYGLQISYRWRKAEDLYQGQSLSGVPFREIQTSNTSSWSVSEGGVLFGLSVYF